MPIGLEIVSVRTWTDRELGAAVAAAWSARGLPEPILTARVATDLVCEVGTDVLQLQVFAPHRRTTLAAAMAVAASSSDDLVVLFLTDFADYTPMAVPILLAAGGALYTAGGVVYAVRRPNPSPGWFGFHEVFHALTIVAFACQYAGVLIATISRRPG